MARLPYTEALLLSVYFEELARHNAKQAKKEANTNAGSGGWETDFEVDEDD